MASWTWERPGERTGGDGMDTAIGVALLAVAIIGLLMLLASFGGLLYIIWQRGKSGAASPKAEAAGGSEGNGQ